MDSTGCWTGLTKCSLMLWSHRDLFSMAQAARVYFKIYRQWWVSKSNDGMAVTYNPRLSIFIPSLSASHWNYCLLSPIGMKLLETAKVHVLIPYIKLDWFSNILEAFPGSPWVKKKSNTKTSLRCRLNIENSTAMHTLAAVQIWGRCDSK